MTHGRDPEIAQRLPIGRHILGEICLSASVPASDSDPAGSFAQDEEIRPSAAERITQMGETGTAAGAGVEG